MVGIVLVSHSRNLVVALESLVRQVSSTDVPIAIAAGVGDDRQEFGTDALEIMDAVQNIYSPEGVLVLMDLGSAVLSAETALDLLPPEISKNIRLCPAPMIEGAIAAAVQAGLGSDLDTVCNEARSALLPKLEQISPPGYASAEGSLSDQTAPAISSATETSRVELTIRNLHGLHARPAARFVKTAASFQSIISVENVTNGKGPVSAKSLNSLATLGAVRGHVIIIEASGSDSVEALQTLSQMVEDGFGEFTSPEMASETKTGVQFLGPPTQIGIMPTSKANKDTNQLQPGEYLATPVSDGIALGPFYRYQPPIPPISDERISDPQFAWDQLHTAMEQTGRAIQQRRKQLTPSLGEEQASIFDAHELILEDPDLQENARRLIYERKLNPAAAWSESIETVAKQYLDLQDPYLKQRAIDVKDVGNQVLFALAGKTDGLQILLPEPVIMFADELTPSETSQLDMAKVLGLMTVGGGPTSHSAILARGLGIPAVSGVNRDIEGLSNGTMIGLDGFAGKVWIEPSIERSTGLVRQRSAWLEERQRLMVSSQTLAATRDGLRIEVAANVGSLMDARAAAENGAEGIGLLRTEFLFLTRSKAPSEEEQYTLLSQIGQALTQNGKTDLPIIVRTLDVGGDKELPYVQLAPEANPFLGVRALRLSLRKPELFLPQLRAILRAGVDYHFRIMYPMVANLDEVLQARQILEQAHQELAGEGVSHLWPVEMGIMVEIPSAALLSRVLAPHVDFFSIGTNDLTQYTLAAERGNPLLAGLADALHPAVLRLIREVAQASHACGKFTGVCGELAGDPLAIPILVGLGVDELSMNPGAIPRAKAILRAVDRSNAQKVAEAALSATGAPEVRGIAREFFAEVIQPALGI